MTSFIPESETILTANQKNVISKAWDNRYGVLMIRELLENVKDQELNNTLMLVQRSKKKLVYVVPMFLPLKFDPEVFLCSGLLPCR